MRDNDQIFLENIYSNLLKEAPIDSFNLVGEWEPTSKKRGYDKASRGILTSNAGVEKIKKLWAKTRQDFDIYMVSTKEGWKYTEVGEVDPYFIRDKLKLDIPINENNITIFFTNNKGAEKVPTTAWTLAHRFGHALRRSGDINGDSYEYIQLDNMLQKMINSVSEKIYKRNLKVSSYEPDFKKIRNIREIQRQVAHALGTFKSARDRKLRNVYEFTNEVIAQYIITGKIVFNREFPKVLPTYFTWGTPQGPYSVQITPELQEEIDDIISYFETEVYAWVDNLVDSAVGKIFVM
jgi:hypothetical protein